LTLEGFNLFNALRVIIIMEKLPYSISQKTDLPGGGSITVTVASGVPIVEADYIILRPGAAAELAECLSGLANALHPPDSKKSSV
jgi:hypothetical protein